jgi:hypothetical protein
VLGYLRGYGYFVGEIYSAITTRFTSWLSVQSNVEVHARDGTRTYKPNPSKEELNHHKIKMKSWPRTMMRCQRKQVKKGRRKKKKVAKKVHESRMTQRNPRRKYLWTKMIHLLRNETSTVMMMILAVGLEARAMVSFRKFLITLSASQFLRLRLSLKGIHLRPTQWWYDFKREEIPRTPTSPKITSQRFHKLASAKFIGYLLTIDRLRGVTQKEPKWNSLLGTYLPLVFLITNFVHDADSLDLMIKILSHEWRSSQPVSNCLTSLNFLPTNSQFSGQGLLDSWSDCLVFSETSNNALRYLLCLLHSKVQSASEGLSQPFHVGNWCWLRVVYKYGLWSTLTAIPACHKPWRIVLCPRVRRNFRTCTHQWAIQQAPTCLCGKLKHTKKRSTKTPTTFLSR